MKTLSCLFGEKLCTILTSLLFFFTEAWFCSSKTKSCLSHMCCKSNPPKCWSFKIGFNFTCLSRARGTRTHDLLLRTCQSQTCYAKHYFGDTPILGMCAVHVYRDTMFTISKDTIIIRVTCKEL